MASLARPLEGAPGIKNRPPFINRNPDTSKKVITSKPPAAMELDDPTSKTVTSTGETKEAASVSSTAVPTKRSPSSLCPPGALRVPPGFNSLQNALDAIKNNDALNCLYLENGLHKIEMTYVLNRFDRNILDIETPVTIIGESRDGCVIVGGLRLINSKKSDDVFIRTLTIKESLQHGIFGFEGASFHLDTVHVDKCQGNGVVVQGTSRNTMQRSEISNSKDSGLDVNDGRVTITNADPGSIHHNCATMGNFENVYNYGAKNSYARTVGEFGMKTNDAGSIHIESPLTKEMISVKNGAGRNYGGMGKIKTINKE